MVSFIGLVISYANELSNYFSEGVEFSRKSVATHSLVFWQWLATVMVPLSVTFRLLIDDQGLIKVNFVCHLKAIWF